MGHAQLSANFYASSCPKALSTIRTAVRNAVSSEKRMGASLLRLHFHDCFVQASLLLHTPAFLQYLFRLCLTIMSKVNHDLFVTG